MQDGAKGRVDSNTRHFAAQLIKLSDLENDFINPHDATSSINAWVVRMTARRLYVPDNSLHRSCCSVRSVCAMHK